MQGGEERERGREGSSSSWRRSGRGRGEKHAGRVWRGRGGVLVALATQRQHRKDKKETAKEGGGAAAVAAA